MDTGDFERELRNRMKARAAELDGSTPPAPRLTTLLVGVDRPRNRDRKGRFGLAFALVGVAALILAVVVPRWFGTYSGDAQPGNVTPSVGLNIVSSPAVRNSTASVPDTQSPSVSPGSRGSGKATRCCEGKQPSTLRIDPQIVHPSWSHSGPGSKVLIPAWLWAGMTTRSTCVGAWVMWAISQGSFQALWECSCALTRGLSRPDL